MNSLLPAQTIVRYLAQQAQQHPALLMPPGSVYIQRVPPNASLPYLRVQLDQTTPHGYTHRASDWSGVMRLTLVCSLSDGAEQLASIHDAVTGLLNQKQLVFQSESTISQLHCWLTSCDEPGIEHDRITLQSNWQIRIV